MENYGKLWIIQREQDQILEPALNLQSVSYLLTACSSVYNFHLILVYNRGQHKRGKDKHYAQNIARIANAVQCHS